MRWITGVLAGMTLSLAACAPTAAPSPTTTPSATAIAAPSLAPSAAPTAASLGQASVSPATSRPVVNIVEHPFRPPQEWTYAPAEVSVKVGTTVVWTNSGAVAHTVTADGGQAFDSGTVDPKATFTLTPKTAGTFAYHCTFHPWMKGTLTVTS